MKKSLERLYIGWLNFIAGVKWPGLKKRFTGREYDLNSKDHRKIVEVLKQGNYIILTWRSTHLTSYLIAIGHFLLTGRWVKWSHACMNIESSEYGNRTHIRILEAIGSGVRLSEFNEVFDCDAVCILRPKMPGQIKWEDVVDRGLKDIGKKYDNFFKLGNDKEMSCVEVILDVLKAIPNWEFNFHGLLAMIKNEKNLTPPMYVECGSFEIVLEIRKGNK